MDFLNGQDEEFFGYHKLRGHRDFQGNLFVSHQRIKKPLLG